jgi:Lrp/AsnC family leucine-responsive transcriptional regulator
MSKIDSKDKKILYELDLNCRQSNSQIGKKVGLGRDVVAYRINNMLHEGIIKNFWTAINTFRLGYEVFRIYITFQYVSQDTKNEIINHFMNYQNTWTVKSHKGEIDLTVIVWTKNNLEFYQFWEETLDKYEDYFAKAIVSVYIQAFCYKKSYLLKDKHDTSEREMYRLTCGLKSLEIDEIDYSLLNEIAVNARIPLIDLAEKLNCSSQTVNYRIKNLQKEQVIQAFRVNIDLSKIDLQHFKVDIYLKEHKKRKAIWNFLKEKPYFEYLNVSVGWCDLEPEFVVKNVNELDKIFSDIDKKFPNVVKKLNFWITEENYRERWLPELNVKE